MAHCTLTRSKTYKNNESLTDMINDAMAGWSDVMIILFVWLLRPLNDVWSIFFGGMLTLVVRVIHCQMLDPDNLLWRTCRIIPERVTLPPGRLRHAHSLLPTGDVSCHQKNITCLQISRWQKRKKNTPAWFQPVEDTVRMYIYSTKWRILTLHAKVSSESRGFGV